MAVPKKRTSSARRDRRRANHDRITAPNVLSCPNCGAPKMSHRMCASCGYYNQRAVMEIVTAVPEDTETSAADDE